jgi:hypothetical protein
MPLPPYDARFFDQPDDVLWLRETHLKHILGTSVIKSFSMLGNEDCPERVTCYGSYNPMWDERPLAVYVFDAETRMLVERQGYKI